MNRIYRCYHCKYINIDDNKRHCPVCGSAERYTFLQSEVDKMSKELLRLVLETNLKVRNNHAVGGKQAIEHLCNPYEFFITKQRDNPILMVTDKRRVLINIVNKINKRSIHEEQFATTESKIQLTIFRLLFRDIPIRTLVIHGKPINDPISWCANIIKENVKILKRDIKYLTKRPNTSIYDLAISPKILAYLEILYNHQYLDERQFMERQHHLLDLIDLYKDYSEWSKEFDNLLDKCLLLYETETIKEEKNGGNNARSKSESLM